MILKTGKAERRASGFTLSAARRGPPESEGGASLRDGLEVERGSRPPVAE
jgi:hypothetical protein